MARALTVYEDTNMYGGAHATNTPTRPAKGGRKGGENKMKQNNINKINAETADEITLCLRHNTDLGRAAITCTNRVYDDEPERTDIICDNLDEDGNPQCNGCWTPWSTRNTKW